LHAAESDPGAHPPCSVHRAPPQFFSFRRSCP
jgi:hypothetical protein